MNDTALRFGLGMMERGLAPDAVIRTAIRRLCAERLEQEKARADVAAFVRGMTESEVAPVPDMANQQHYELPPEFFGHVLGRQRKYSSCFWADGCRTLDDAETAALAATCERAGLRDGQRVLELGCGWGSLSLWMAQHYPASLITAVSNSAPQRRYIEAEAARRQLRNLRVLTADMNSFQAPERYDRIVSVEMFEHMRNYGELLRRTARWMNAGGKLFVHIFCHREFAYRFDTEGAHNWMGQHFFTGGMMPSEGLLWHFQDDLRITAQWRWDGTHYSRTSEAWLANLDRSRSRVWPLLTSTYGRGEETRWFQRWRVFFLSCAELFGYRHGREWMVCHYLLEPR